MTVFMDLLLEMLPLHSNLQKQDNELRKVLDRSIGEYFDNIADIKDQLFLSSAGGSWLDCFGKDYGVVRKLDESDEDYLDRIVFEKLEHLTVGNLMSIYNLDLFAFVDNYNPLQNQLTSDNPYSSQKFMSYADEDLQKILDKKFILDYGVVWI